MTRLQHAIERTRAAVLARAGGTLCPDRVGGLVQPPGEMYTDEGHTNFEYNLIRDNIMRKPDDSGENYTPRTMLDPACGPGKWRIEPPAPVVRVSAPTPAPAPPLLTFSAPEAVRAGLSLSAGAARVFDALHRLACEVARARGYRAIPDAVTLHLPQGLLALGVGYTPRHLRRLLPELVTAGLIDCGAHASKVGGMSLWDGYLWAVKVRPGVETLPHLNREEWRHGWRDFAGDIEAGRTVKALLEGMSALHPEQAGNVVKDALTAWSVNPGNINIPVVCSADMGPGEGLDGVQDVREIVYRLGQLPHVHASKRAGIVGRLASALSLALDDRHSRRWYCAVIWGAWRGYTEGRADLEALAGALVRIDEERREWEGLRNPAALLAARLRAG